MKTRSTVLIFVFLNCFYNQGFSISIPIANFASTNISVNETSLACRNPVADEFTIDPAIFGAKILSRENIMFSIFNLLGEREYHSAAATSGIIDCKFLSPGMHVIEVDESGQKAYGKIIKV